MKGYDPWLMRWLLALALLPLPALAGPLAGADDPALRAALQAVLTADDYPAASRLHDLAASNPAALQALPFVQRWLPQTGRLEASLAVRQLGGTAVADLAAAAYKPAALWQGGAISPTMRDQLNRALWLYDLGETAKADGLLQAWYNHMPEAAPLPEGFATLPAAPILKAMILLNHLTRGDHKALAVLQDWLDRDLIEGWMVFAELSDHYPVTAGEPIMAGLRLGANTGARLQDGRRAFRLLWHEEPPPPLPPETLAMMMRDLMPRPQFAPVRAYCAAACPGSAATCEAAFVTFLGAPFHTVAEDAPFRDTLGEAELFASPRGAEILLSAGTWHRLGLDRTMGYHGAMAANPAFLAAQALDPCFATGVLQALPGLPLKN